MPNLTVVGCADHQKVADEIAERSITLVRDQASLLPLHLQLGRRIVVVIPKPQDLPPADKSWYIVPALAILGFGHESGNDRRDHFCHPRRT